MSVAVETEARGLRRSAGRRSASVAIPLLLAVLAATAIVALTVGAAGIPLARLPAALGLVSATAPPNAVTARDQLVLWSIRIPRIAATAMVGGLLAAAGAIMQGLFRNPLADPALVGVSSGGALAAASAIVFTDSRFGETFRFLQTELLPLAAFAGSLATTAILYGISSRAGRTSIAIFLLAGVAITAITNAGIGLSGVHRRRPPASRHHVLDAGLDERCDLDQGRRARTGPRGRARWLAPSSRAASISWCSAKPMPFTAGSMSSV